MRKQAFGEDHVAVIGLGCWEFGGKCAESQAKEFMDAYIELGGNFIDTASLFAYEKTAS